MANFQNNFRLKSKMLVLTAVLISLSVSPSTTETRKCYWCGPLAEQVHRSTRAPPCNEPSIHVTACDPGFTHCAVVATSPPYTESRLCVKLYQDECYSLYCNSTKIWRMTCPCRGDLCNGPNTQREKEAFSILTKLVAKPQNTRNKRTLISTPNFITNNNSYIDNNTNLSLEINMTINKDIEHGDGYNVHSDKTNSENIVTNLQITDNNTDITKAEVTMTTDEYVKTENDILQTTPQENTQTHIKDNTASTGLTTQSTATIQHEESSTIPLAYPSKKLPNAEALQQNASPNEKVNETTVTEPSIKSTLNTMHDMETTEPTTKRNNTATQINNHLLTIVLVILLNYCI